MEKNLQNNALDRRFLPKFQYDTKIHFFRSENLYNPLFTRIPIIALKNLHSKDARRCFINIVKIPGNNCICRFTN